MRNVPRPDKQHDVMCQGVGTPPGSRRLLMAKLPIPFFIKMPLLKCTGPNCISALRDPEGSEDGADGGELPVPSLGARRRLSGARSARLCPETAFSLSISFLSLSGELPLPVGHSSKPLSAAGGRNEGVELLTLCQPVSKKWQEDASVSRLHVLNQIKAGVRFLGSFFSPAEGFYLPSTLKPTIFHDIDVMERKWVGVSGWVCEGWGRWMGVRVGGWEFGEANVKRKNIEEEQHGLPVNVEISLGQQCYESRSMAEFQAHSGP
ncbi:hypothetical protein BaRGS_00003912, partial [Batillaria attramentaria]